MSAIRLILGIDPGLQHTGWGLVTQSGNRLSFVAAGRISPDRDMPMAARLFELSSDLAAIITEHEPDESATVSSRVLLRPDIARTGASQVDD